MVDEPIEKASRAPYGEPGQAPRRLAVVGLGWPVVAALAVLASFAQVYSVTAIAPDANGAMTDFVRLAFDGWGRLSVKATGPDGFRPSGVTGPRYGVLFCIAAGAVLLGWLQSLRATPARWQPSGRTISGAGCAFLTGIVACQVLATLPNRRDLFRIYAVFHWGPSPWIAGGACALGVLTWAAQHRLERRLAAADGQRPSDLDRTADGSALAGSHPTEDEGI